MRSDYVNSTLSFASNNPGTGCGLLFLYYLRHRLGFSVADIIANAPGLDSSGNLLAAAFPPDQVASQAGSNVDDPWPLGPLTSHDSKNTWGQDEINDIINHGGTYTGAINLALDGFSLNTVGSSSPSSPKIAFGGVTSSPAGAPSSKR